MVKLPAYLSLAALALGGLAAAKPGINGLTPEQMAASGYLVGPGALSGMTLTKLIEKGTPPAVSPRAREAAPDKDWTDTIKDALVVYDNKDTFVQKVRFATMTQFQVAAVQPNGSNGLHLKDGASPVNQEFRRVWLGANVDFASGTHFHTWFRPGGLPMRETYADGRTRRNFSYTNLFDLWVSQDIKAVKGLNVKVGKIKPLFTTEYSTSSSAIKTIERSYVANQYGFDSNWGLDVTYAPSKADKFYFQLFANDRAPTNKSLSHKDVYRDGRGFKGEFGWEDKCFAIIGASHKFAQTESGYHQVSAQFAHDFDNTYGGSTKKGANSAGPGVKDALSLGYDYKHNQFTFLANLVLNGEMLAGGGNNVGLVLMPVYALTPRVDLVFRYTGMTGDSACKLGADRYIGTQCNTPTWVDSLHAFYVGVDLYASAKNPNAAKLMFGAEYTTARDGGSDCYNGWEFSTAARWNF